MSDYEELRIGVYVCSCGSNIGGVIDPAAVAEFAKGLPDVVVDPRQPVHVRRPRAEPHSRGHPHAQAQPGGRRRV
jgi:hypothetical protein